MSKTERLLGLTTTLKRLAFYYMKKGIGEFPCEHGDYDKVVVKELYSWTTPSPDVPAQGGIAVEFYVGPKRVRWIEFACRDVGGGGDPVIREV